MAAILQRSAAVFPVTVLPVWTGGDFRLGRTAKLKSILDSQPSLFLSRGAVAIKLALTAERIGAGDEVLAPAFHCPSMIDPIVATGASPKFYGITEELSIDLVSLKRLISPVTRAILAPHFFGRIQDFRELRDLCTSAKVVLIEDCAHALTGADRSREVGEFGDYVIASPRKFAPVGEGGFLGGNRLRRTTLQVGRPSFQQNARLLFDMSDRAVAAGRLSILRAPIWLLKRLKQATPGRFTPDFVAQELMHREPDNQLAKELSVSGEASAVTRFLLKRWDFDGAAAARRENYRRLADAVFGSSQYRVVASGLPLSRAPYMLPVLLSDPSKQFAAIKKGPTPVWRWEHSQRGVCKVTDHYAEALIQTPCHQSLADDDVSRIADFFQRKAQ